MVTGRYHDPKTQAGHVHCYICGRDIPRANILRGGDVWSGEAPRLCGWICETTLPYRHACSECLANHLTLDWETGAIIDLRPLGFKKGVVVEQGMISTKDVPNTRPGTVSGRGTT